MLFAFYLAWSELKAPSSRRTRKRRATGIVIMGLLGICFLALKFAPQNLQTQSFVILAMAILVFLLVVVGIADWLATKAKYS